MQIIENDPGKSDTPANRRISAISSFLLDRDPLVLALASRLGGRDVTFESASRGSSMSPAIPGRVRLRIRLLAEQPCHPGDIVYFLTDNGFVVHRVIYRSRKNSAAGYLLTLGDNCLSPDPPVRNDRILGTVIAVHTAGEWRSPSPPINRSVLHRLIRAATSATMIATVTISVPAARRLAAVFLELESVGRVPVGRLLRRLHRNHLKR